MLFDGSGPIVRVVVVGVLAYAALVVLLRVSGKRTLSKLNAFDFVVTVALGSTLATVLLNKDVSLAEGVAAFAVLIFAQYAITALSVRSRAIRKLVKSEPRLLAYRGEVLDDALRQERVTLEEIHAVLRGEGYASLDHVAAVILETDGSIHAIDFPESQPAPAIVRVRGFPGVKTEAGAEP